MGFSVKIWRCKDCGFTRFYTFLRAHPKELHDCQYKEANLLTAFQIYLNEKGLISNHDWDFEKEAKKFLRLRK